MPGKFFETTFVGAHLRSQFWEDVPGIHIFNGYPRYGYCKLLDKSHQYRKLLLGFNSCKINLLANSVCMLPMKLTLLGSLGIYASSVVLHIDKNY